MDKILEVDMYGAVRASRNHPAWEAFIKSMDRNNTFCPGIKRILFNLKTTEVRPVLDADGNPVKDEKGRVKRQTVEVTPSLATIVYFMDGTKCAVVNSDKDVVTLVDKEVTYFETKKDGTQVEVKTNRKVKVASDAAKEAGVVYALVKRLFGTIENDPEKKGYGVDVKGDGFGRKLRDICDSAFDTQYEAAFSDEMNKLSVKAHKEREAAAKERRAHRTPTIEENIAELVKQNAELLAKLTK